ncbi:hypothetical protein EYF80_067915 [Liparis tanakae]|uniref:Uncharacterized protein n=1 Tax=Liparis tanakae TaxID=230148 RepID=A0A4Z2DZL1_9TELE|nr:hypothetical protein EYF80_067915 [Liparis tanakae]
MRPFVCGAALSVWRFGSSVFPLDPLSRRRVVTPPPASPRLHAVSHRRFDPLPTGRTISSLIYTPSPLEWRTGGYGRLADGSKVSE